jgi:hypothetical protein
MGRKYHFSLLEPRWPSAAYEHLIARGGLNLAAAGTPLKAQIDLAILGVTRTCPYRCAHATSTTTWARWTWCPVGLERCHPGSRRWA